MTCQELVEYPIRIAGAVPPEPLTEDAERDLLAAFRDWKR